MTPGAKSPRFAGRSVAALLNLAWIGLAGCRFLWVETSLRSEVLASTEFWTFAAAGLVVANGPVALLLVCNRREPHLEKKRAMAAAVLLFLLGAPVIVAFLDAGVFSAAN